MVKALAVPTGNSGTDGSGVLVIEDLQHGQPIPLPQNGVSYDIFVLVASGVPQIPASYITYRGAPITYRGAPLTFQGS